MRRDIHPKTVLARLSQPPRRPDVLRPLVASSREEVDTLNLHLALNDLDDACWLLDAVEMALQGRPRRKLRKRARRLSRRIDAIYHQVRQLRTDIENDNNKRHPA